MRRLSKTLPRYCRHRASGQAVVTLNGRDIYLGRYGSRVSRLEYDHLIAEWLAHGRRLPGQEVQEPLSVSELVLAYWKHAQRYYMKDGKPTGEVGAYRVVLRDLQRLYGRTPAGELGPSLLRALRQTWIDRDLARTTINQHMNRVVRMFRWAEAQEMIEPSVVQALAAVDGLRKGRSAARDRGERRRGGRRCHRAVFDIESAGRHQENQCAGRQNDHHYRGNLRGDPCRDSLPPPTRDGAAADQRAAGRRP